MSHYLNSRRKHRPPLNRKIFDQFTHRYHQVVVTKSDVILRTWPKRRMSQTWTRDGNLNPTDEKAPHDEFLKGELPDQIKQLFGAETLEKILVIVNSSQ